MQEPAPKGIEEKVARELNKLGHPSTPQSVSADHSSVLEGAGEIVNDTGDYLGTTLEEMRGGATHVRHAPGRKGLILSWEKAKRKMAIFNKKAA